eukprot:scaffold45979_cov59-Phaeocystis_antarctica.AAC.1
MSSLLASERKGVFCRVGRRAYGVGRGAAPEAGGCGAVAAHTQRAGERALLQIRGRARVGAHEEDGAHVRDLGRVEAQRLVEDRRALPSVKPRAYGAGRRAAREAGGRRAIAVHAACTGEGSTADSGQGTGRSARVEAQRLVERLRVLPRVERRAYGVGRGAGGQEGAAGDRGTSSVQGRARLQIRSRPRGGAHLEHVAHVRDAGGVEAQRLVERMRVHLPIVKRRAYDAGEGVAPEAAGGGRPRRTQRAQGRAGLHIGGRARGGAHVEHVPHGRDAGGVEAQRLVERLRVLPRVERRAY